MANLLVSALLIFSGFDLGGQVGSVFTTGGISRTCHTGTLLGAQLGYQNGRARLEFSYSYFTFPAKGLRFYELSLHQMRLSYRYEFLYRREWGAGLEFGPVLGFARRRSTLGREDGRTGGAHIGLIVVQHQGRSLISAGFDNAIFVEWGKGSGPVLTYFPVIKAGVGYVF